MPKKQNEFQINQRDQLDRIIAAVSVHAPWSVPLYRGVRDGRVNLIQPQRDAVLTATMLTKSSRPLIVLVSDDDYQSTGPSGWACASILQSWGFCAVIHAAAGEPQDYELAVETAWVIQRFVLVETATAFQTGWQNHLGPHMPTLTIQAIDYFPHPKVPAPGATH